MRVELFGGCEVHYDNIKEREKKRIRILYYVRISFV
jgi:hypothetical protein